MPLSPTETIQTTSAPEQNFAVHFVSKNPITAPFPSHLQQIIFGLGCFWGAERKFWQQSGVFSTAVGFTGGTLANPSYKDVCSGLTEHNEVVLIVFNPEVITYSQLLAIFWESHNPTQGNRQGNDIGTQYRSGIYTFNALQKEQALESKQHYQNKLSVAGFSKISTEIVEATKFYYAEEYHQQYLAKNPQGYCGLGGLGVKF